MTQDLSKDISSWLKTYLVNNGLECFVIGVSGGVDSAVSSTLCAATGIPTYVVNIPIRSKQESTDLSKLHCDWLCEEYPNVEQLYVDATASYEAFEEIFKHSADASLLANANSKSRMRMMVLYYLATSRKGIVVGTGNKVEDFGVGFFTKYGDGGVDISPIADLTKTKVRELALELGVSEEILNAVPTDGLWEDNRTDEDQIGASYEELEWAMDYIDNNRQGDLTTRQVDVLEAFLFHRNKNKHKMNGIPVYKVGEENE